MIALGRCILNNENIVLKYEKHDPSNPGIFIFKIMIFRKSENGSERNLLMEWLIA